MTTQYFTESLGGIFNHLVQRQQKCMLRIRSVQFSKEINKLTHKCKPGSARGQAREECKGKVSGWGKRARTLGLAQVGLVLSFVRDSAVPVTEAV